MSTRSSGPPEKGAPAAVETACVRAVQRLTNSIQRYAWGSLTEIPRLLRVPPDGQPQAELWLGAHPSAPSRLRDGTSLDVYCAREASRVLGGALVERFGPQLPFLLKVLAAGQPLSLQAHPTIEQARAGFAREEAAGIAINAPPRSYKDANHKPEIICALTPFRALCGFRAHAETVRLFSALGLDTSILLTGLRPYFEHVMTLGKGDAAALVSQLLDGARRGVEGFASETALALELDARYPGDVGIVGALLLNLVTLQPGQALYLGAGNLHAYLEGTGVELMANSDNVLRGGLTPKHVDVNELLSVLDFAHGPAKVLTANDAGLYQTPAPDFQLSRLALDGTQTLPSGRPHIILVVEGTVQCGEEQLEAGDAVFIGADESITLTGRGVLFRATTGM